MAEWLKALDCKSSLVRVRGFESLPANKIGALAQLARASVWQIEGRRFKSCRLHNKIASGDARVELCDFPYFFYLIYGMRRVLSGTEKSSRFRGEIEPKTSDLEKLKNIKNWLKKKLRIKSRSHE